MSNIYKKGEYEYIPSEKRFGGRVDFELDVYYPMVNNESVYNKYKTKGMVMRVINISKTGVFIQSKITLNKGDFINFTLKIEENPSFWCLVEVKRVCSKRNVYYAGCQFFSLSMDQIKIIQEYVNKNSMNF